MNPSNCSLPQEMIDEILKWTRLMGPPDDPVHRQAITELNDDLLERFPRWSEEIENEEGRMRCRLPYRWPDPIWYKHWISHIDERGRIVNIRPELRLIDRVVWI